MYVEFQRLLESNCLIIKYVTKQKSVLTVAKIYLTEYTFMLYARKISILLTWFELVGNW